MCYFNLVVNSHLPDIGSILTAEVFEARLASSQNEPRVPAGNRGRIKHHIRSRIPADHILAIMEEKLLPTERQYVPSMFRMVAGQRRIRQCADLALMDHGVDVQRRCDGSLPGEVHCPNMDRV
jgi:hypothetical protein